MNTAQPIRDKAELERFKAYYKTVNPNMRNYLLIIIGLNTALRISDILSMRWEMVYDFALGSLRTHISLTEKKTGKATRIFMNRSIQEALWQYIGERKEDMAEGQYLFAGRESLHEPITRVQAFRIVKKAAGDCKISGVISCHSLRKTFGYHAWKQGTSSVLLMHIYNHSSFQVTKRYLGIEQDDRDSIFQSIVL